MSASKYSESHKLDKISMQHKNHQTRESQPFTPCVFPVIMSSCTVTNLSPATSSFPCQYHSTIVHSHLRLKKTLIETWSIRKLKPLKEYNSLFCISEALHRTDFAVFLLLQNLITRKYRVSINCFPDYKHKLFPWLQTFITRKLRGIQMYNCNITINTWHKILEINLSNSKKNMFAPHVIFL
jgi:hypothetical protein